MSQDISTNQSTSEPVAESLSLKPWSAEAYADQLMDDLFSDIDHILDGSSKLPTEPAKQEYASLQAIKVPQIAMPPAVIPLQQVLAQQSETVHTPQETPPAKSNTIPPIASGSPPARHSGKFNKLLLVATIGSLAIALILWWASYKKLLTQWLHLPDTSASQNTLSQSDTQFINYMLRSLELIDRKAQVSKQQTNPGETSNQQSGTASGTSQPLPPVANNPAQSPNLGPTVVYMPPGYYPGALQYQPPQVASPILSPTANPIRPSATSAIRPPAANSIRPLPTNPALPQPSKPSISPRRPASIPSVASSLNPTQAAPDPKYTLVGLLYLGDRSAALFDITGVTQRIQVGEPIGASGWTLVAVTKDEAIIRRNGEVRSIYAGQKF